MVGADHVAASWLAVWTGFEERTRRIKLYRKKAALHAEKARREAELRAKKDLSKALGGRGTEEEDEEEADTNTSSRPRREAVAEELVFPSRCMTSVCACVQRPARSRRRTWTARRPS